RREEIRGKALATTEVHDSAEVPRDDRAAEWIHREPRHELIAGIAEGFGPAHVSTRRELHEEDIAPTVGRERLESEVDHAREVAREEDVPTRIHGDAPGELRRGVAEPLGPAAVAHFAGAIRASELRDEQVRVWRAHARLR